MEVELRLEPGRREPKVVLLAGEETRGLRELCRRLEELRVEPVPAWRGEELVYLPQEAFLRFYTDGKGVRGQTAEGAFAVRERLYELEERLDGGRFVRISHSEMVNLDRITALDLSLSGTIRITLDGGAAVCYASRRYVRRIKETLQARKGGLK